MLIRAERPTDVEAIRKLTTAAFAGAPHAAPQVDGIVGEAALVDWLRADDGWIPELSLLSIDGGGDVVGHVVCTRGAVGCHPALGLGPISVRPDRQRAGVGTALITTVIAAAEARDEAMIAVLGEPQLYARFGFAPASRFGVEAPSPGWGDYFQLKMLAAYRPEMRGAFRYATPFARL